MCEGIEMKAFPSNQPVSGTMGFYADGMELRDYFAAKAMPSLVKTLEYHITTPNDVAKLAYQYADAMMKAREQ
jgi:hypothetical protein